MPVFVTDEDDTITENVAILDRIAAKAPTLVPREKLGRTRLLEALARVSTEPHQNFEPFFAGGTEEQEAKTRETIGKRLTYVREEMPSVTPMGRSPSHASASRP